MLEKNGPSAVLLFIILNTAISSFAQSNFSAEKLFHKKWTIESYKIGEKELVLQSFNDYTSFFSDSTFKTNNSGIVINGKWKASTDQRSIILYSEKSGSEQKLGLYIY